ncbi:hypothetical protein PP175_28220 (plasmid) [Aneurinibacillus sp. Ricciae_BoGa-3]|uniref:hypothetical protein n=1 Tax=Aneurinibacillus sp. Ricciae_BoGa-3 TaxID=3022697 RepID=UPI002341E337|nr:hypothetical protein [Aneurinibacillus sp. Ricciae_BoGa-3]WCK57077.1 hypothetical protein PP175_28220 [Aneurinibacillus sp. Ricciae_BoGa-3]
MDDKALERKVKEFLKSNLTIETQKVGGEYESKSYTKLELKLGEEVISTTYLDD